MTDMIKEFFDFILERQSIWHKRFILKKEPPWTGDAVLMKYKIINVYRELDKGTIYIIKRLAGIKDRKKLLLNIIFYRFFNQYGLYENLEIKPFEKLPKEKILSSLEMAKAEGKPIFSNAYLISSGTRGKAKHLSVLEAIESIDAEKITLDIDNSKSPKESLEILMQIPMIGPFLACEIWTDLTYFGFFKKAWTDNDFVNIGPGAKWGLEIIFEKRMSKKEQEEKLSLLYNLQYKYLNNDLWKNLAYKNAFSNYPFLSITNIESSLCEFRKYWRLRSGKGKRRIFNPSSQS